MTPMSTQVARQVMRRDYSLVGEESAKAVAAGMRSAEWYKSPVDRKRMKELMKRSDGPATRHTLIWLAILLGTGTAGVLTWRSWWSWPIFFVYGTFYGSTSDARWHECGHRTAFKTDWKNNAVYQLACFMLWREPELWRWSHTRHHTDTIIVGLDPEIITPAPSSSCRAVRGHLVAEDRPSTAPRHPPSRCRTDVRRGAGLSA